MARSKLLYPPQPSLGQVAQLATGLPLRSPFVGYVPDLAQVYRNIDGLISCKAVAVRGGRLVQIDGWSKLDSSPTSLPLGHNGDGPAGFTDSAFTPYGPGATAVVTAGNDKAQPVMHLAAFQRFSAGSGLGDLESLAITADTGTIPGGAPPFQETGHLFRRISGTAAWQSIEFGSDNGLGAGAPAANAVPLTGTVDNWIDSTIYTPGIPGQALIDVDLAAGPTNREIRAVAESVFVFTNYVDSVMYYPHRTSSTNYSDFRSYVAQLVAFGSAMVGSGTNTVFYQAPEFTTLNARSVATFAGRVCYFNTVEGGVYRPTRLRWSITGNPFIVWPSFEITLGNPALFHMNGVGAGYFDLDQFKTPGVVCKTLGDVLACYSKDGLAFARRTGVVTDPISVEYVTLDRGAMASGAVCAITAAQHFAIMTDGWYLVNANGVMTEVGVTPERQNVLGGSGRTYKWKEDFYRRLDFSAVRVNRLLAVYEPATKMVRIAAPMSDDTTEIWNYDTQNDRVFLDNYEGTNGRDQSPRALGQLPRLSGSATTWAGAGPTSWAGYTGRSWASFGSTVYAELEFAHGDIDGYVYIHDPELPTRDTVLGTWHWRTAPRSLVDNPDVTVLLDGIVATYDNIEGSSSGTATLEAVAFSDRYNSTSAAYSETAAIDLSHGNAGQIAVDDVGFRVTGENHQIAMTGAGSLSLHELRIRVVVEGTPHRRLEGS